ncbi:MAG: DUF4389 domain-containing protein [Chloroflexi bacterium]|nr:DUF4389 domain-containing protein [Chloroflexota bacterium]
MARQANDGYPVVFDVEYPDGPQDRFKAAFRIIFAIPILILAATMERGTQGGFFIIAPALMIIFRRKYPRWWFDFNLELGRFWARVYAYVGLLREEYPATDDHQAVTLEIEYPDFERDLNRWLPLVKWILAIPHYIVLILLFVAVILALIVAWFAILFTGHFPRGLFDFVVGVSRWSYRVEAYAFYMATDKYPPFSLD